LVAVLDIHCLILLFVTEELENRLLI